MPEVPAENSSSKLSEAPESGQAADNNPQTSTKRSGGGRKKQIIILVVLAIIFLGLAAYGLWSHYHQSPAPVVASKSSASTIQSVSKVQGLQLNASKNYGNKYANGILPDGDGMYTTAAPKVGYVYACSQYAQNLATSQGGAMTRGPWFSGDGKTYDVNKKLHVEGSIKWDGQFTDTVSGNIRTITSNDLPIVGTTGVFPIQTSDPAYTYDHNPNTIEGQSFTYALSADPTYSITRTAKADRSA